MGWSYYSGLRQGRCGSGGHRRGSLTGEAGFEKGDKTGGGGLGRRGRGRDNRRGGDFNRGENPEILGGGVNGADKSSQPGGEGAAGNRQKSHSRAGDSTDENKRILEDYGDREAKENESQDNAAGQLQKLL